jgi:hypothetical protein
MSALPHLLPAHRLVTMGECENAHVAPIGDDVTLSCKNHLSTCHPDYSPYDHDVTRGPRLCKPIVAVPQRCLAYQAITDRQWIGPFICSQVRRAEKRNSATGLPTRKTRRHQPRRIAI